MAVYQDKAKERIKKGLRRMNGIVERALRDDYKEADTRKITLFAKTAKSSLSWRSNKSVSNLRKRT